jgi:aryl-alcohol dehydrogenase-like predicted oxidoreductase
MEPLHFKGIDQRLTPFVLGTMTFGDNADIKAAGEMLELFLEAAGNGIDTANGYSGGRSESMLAALLRGRREQVVLATKIGIPHPDAAGVPRRCPSTGSGAASPPASTGSAPTTSKCSTCTNPTGPPRSPRHSPPSRSSQVFGTT